MKERPTEMTATYPMRIYRIYRFASPGGPPEDAGDFAPELLIRRPHGGRPGPRPLHWLLRLFDLVVHAFGLLAFMVGIAVLLELVW